MRRTGFFGLAVLAVAALASGQARANACQTDKLACATTMPVGGFCECTSHGTTEDGSVVGKLPPGVKLNATAGGCGVNPGAPGCR